MFHKLYKRKSDKKTKVENSTKLSNLLDFTKELMEKNSGNVYRSIKEHPVYDSVIYPLANEIQNIITINLITLTEKQLNEQECRIDYRTILRSIGNISMLNNAYESIPLTSTVTEIEDNEQNTYDLSHDIVIAPIWKQSRYINNLAHIGTDVNNPFKQNLNHSATEILPLGILVVSNGNHSIYAAKYKREGILRATERLDLTNSFKYIHFDGTNMIVTKESDKNYIYGDSIVKPICFEAGALFEVARIINEYI